MRVSRRDFLQRGALAFSAPMIFGPGLLMPKESLAIDGSEALRPEILQRSAWAGDLAPRGELFGEDVRFLLVHHTASSNEYAEGDVAGLLRGFFEFHTGADKRWSDIAYNFLIDRFGRIWEGRRGSLDGPVAGDATGGNQGFAQLCCLIGDFTTDLPSGEALASLELLLAWLADRYEIPTASGSTASFRSRGSNRWAGGTQVETPTIAGHRDMSLTACPGDAFYPYVTSQLMGAVHEIRVGSTTSVPAETAATTSTTLATSTTIREETTTTRLSPSTTAVMSPTSSSLPIVLGQEENVGSDSDLATRGLIGAGAVAALLASIAAARRNRHPNRDSGPA